MKYKLIATRPTCHPLSLLGFLEPPPNDKNGLSLQISELVQGTPNLLKQKKVCTTLAMPIEIEMTEATPQQKMDLFCDLAFLAQAFFVEADSSSLPKVLPDWLAEHLVSLGDELGLPPIQSYHTYILGNWSSEGEISLESVKGRRTFTDSVGEHWFIAIHVVTEHYIASAIKELGELVTLVATSASPSEMHKVLEPALNKVAQALKLAKTTIAKMSEKLAPDYFYNEMRPFLAKQINIKLGVEGTKRSYIGASGAQSVFVPYICGALGVTIKNNPILIGMRPYMKKSQLSTVEFGEKNHVRQFIDGNGTSSEKKAYNSVIGALHGFLKQHLSFVPEYIMKPAKKSKPVQLTVEQSPMKVSIEGTGGSNPMKYLTERIREILTFKFPS